MEDGWSALTKFSVRLQVTRLSAGLEARLYGRQDARRHEGDGGYGSAPSIFNPLFSIFHSDLPAAILSA